MVKIPIGENVFLEGDLDLPDPMSGIVLFAHGSGSSRFSPRNRAVAEDLRDHQLGTLLIDLLTEEEDEVDQVTREFRFDIDLLAQRLRWVIKWIKEDAQTKKWPLGLFGSSTGAAAALIAAAEEGEMVSAVVSRGGRPDLATPFLSRVRAPTLFIVGGNDSVVIELNEQAYALLSCEKRMELIPGASHLFEEPGALGQVSHMAAKWFSTHF